MFKKKSWKEPAMTKGLIFDIQRFSLNDGPGIRTTVFFKGCGLRCAWCHNPESIASYQQLSYDSTRCDGCQKCMVAVGGKGISILNQKAVVDMDIHDRTLELVGVCPQNCFRVLGDEKTVDEIVNVVLKDLDYYRESHGGVTFSGGEALNQWPFIESVAKKLKEHGLHLTLDISGYDPAGLLSLTTDLIDLYLLDLKASDHKIYKTFVGQSLDPKQMLEILKKANKPVILRCPLIPDINDDPGYFDLLAKLVDEYDNIIETNVLPYHKLRKNQSFKLLNDRQFFSEPDSIRKEIWAREIRDRKIRNVWMENSEILL